MDDDKINEYAKRYDSHSLPNNINLPAVLLVEDDVINASVIQKFLKNICKVDVAYTSKSCLEMIRANEYSVILLDINLGRGMNGIDVLNEIKKLDKNANTPVIASTAYTMKGDKEKLLQAGFDDYISKPFTMKEIQVKIKQYIKKESK